jgi:hypothetical protein
LANFENVENLANFDEGGKIGLKGAKNIDPIGQYDFTEVLESTGSPKMILIRF